MTNGWQKTITGDLRFVRGDDGVPNPSCLWSLKGVGQAVWFAPMLCRVADGMVLSNETEWYGERSPFSAFADLYWSYTDLATQAYKAWIGWVGGNGILISPGDAGAGAGPFVIEVLLDSDGMYSIQNSPLDCWPLIRPLHTSTYLSGLIPSEYPDFHARLSFHCDHSLTGAAYDAWVILSSYIAITGGNTDRNSYGPAWIGRGGVPSQGVIAFGVERASEYPIVFNPRSQIVNGWCAVDQDLTTNAPGTGLPVYNTCVIPAPPDIPLCQIAGAGSSTFHSQPAPASIGMSGGTIAASASHPIGPATALLPFSLSQTLFGELWTGAAGGAKVVGPYTFSVVDTSQTTPACAGEDPGSFWTESVAVIMTIDGGGGVILSVQYACTKPSAVDSKFCEWNLAGATYEGNSSCSGFTLNRTAILGPGSLGCPGGGPPCPNSPIDSASWPATLTLSV